MVGITLLLKRKTPHRGKRGHRPENKSDGSQAWTL